MDWKRDSRQLAPDSLRKPTLQRKRLLVLRDFQHHYIMTEAEEKDALQKPHSPPSASRIRTDPLRTPPPLQPHYALPPANLCNSCMKLFSHQRHGIPFSYSYRVILWMDDYYWTRDETKCWFIIYPLITYPLVICDVPASRFPLLTFVLFGYLYLSTSDFPQHRT